LVKAEKKHVWLRLYDDGEDFFIEQSNSLEHSRERSDNNLENILDSDEYSGIPGSGGFFSVTRVIYGHTPIPIQRKGPKKNYTHTRSKKKNYTHLALKNLNPYSISYTQNPVGLKSLFFLCSEIKFINYLP
jgi:hypothetical protein